MWNRLSKREKFLLFGLLGTAVFFCFYYYIFNPQLKAYNQVKTELDEQRTKLFRAQNTAASLTTETAQLEKVKAWFSGFIFSILMLRISARFKSLIPFNIFSSSLQKARMLR
jgi:Tfp pilus assembly protein PilO